MMGEFILTATDDAHAPDIERPAPVARPSPTRHRASLAGVALCLLVGAPVHAQTVVSMSTSSDWMSEGSVTNDTIVLAVYLDTAPTSSVTIPLSVSSTTTGYSISSTRLTFPAGDTNQTFTVTAENDFNTRNDTVSVCLGSLPSGYTAGSPSCTSITILDDDTVPVEVTVAFDATSYAAIEGAQPLKVALTLDKSPGRTINVPIVAEPETGSWTLSAESAVFSYSRTATIEVSAPEDADYSDQTLTLSLGTLPSLVSAGDPASTTVKLLDLDESPPPPTPLSVAFSASAYTAHEGDDVELRVNMTPAATRTVRVPLTVTPPDGSFSLSRSELVFQSGDTVQSATLSATHDEDVHDELVTVAIGALPNAVSRHSPSTTAVTLVDDDRRPLTLSFERTGYETTEGGAVDIAISLNAPADRDLLVPLVTTPAEGSFALSASTLAFAPGDTAATVTLTAIEDDNDLDDTVTITFRDLPDGLSLGAPAAANVTLIDNDAPPITVAFDRADYTVTEGDSVPIAVTVHPSPPRRLVIPIIVTPGSHTAPSTIALEFAPGDTAQSVAVAALQDDNNLDETVTIGFGTLPAGVLAGTPDAATLTLVDDDKSSLTAAFERPERQVLEGDAVDITVRLNAPTDRPLLVPLTATPAEAPFTLSTHVLAFAPGDTSATVTLTATEDDNKVHDTVTIGFGTLPAGVRPIAPDSATVRILDNDLVSLTAAFEHASYRASTERPLSIAVRLSAPADRPLIVPLTATPAQGPFALSPPTLAFAPGDTAATVTLTVTEDDNDVDDTVTIGFGELPSGVFASTPATATVALVDADAPIALRFGRAAYDTLEGAAGVTVSVRLHAPAPRALSIPLTTTPATGPFDLSAHTIEFDFGDIERTVTVSATPDNDAVHDTVTLAFGELPPGVSAAVPATAEVTLSDLDLSQVLSLRLLDQHDRDFSHIVL